MARQSLADRAGLRRVGLARSGRDDRASLPERGLRVAVLVLLRSLQPSQGRPGTLGVVHLRATCESYSAEEGRPLIIDLSGGSPDLVPEWTLWMIGRA